MEITDQYISHLYECRNKHFDRIIKDQDREDARYNTATIESIEYNDYMCNWYDNMIDQVRQLHSNIQS